MGAALKGERAIIIHLAFLSHFALSNEKTMGFCKLFAIIQFPFPSNRKRTRVQSRPSRGRRYDEDEWV